MRFRAYITLLTTAGSLFLLQACSSDSGSDTKDSNDDPKESSSKTSSKCSGDITDCTMGSLSDKQYQDACSTILAAIDSPAGTKYECKEGPHDGMFLSVNSVAQCAATQPPSTCSVKVGELIDCYKAAKKDACAAFDDECTPMFDSNSGCAPK